MPTRELLTPSQREDFNRFPDLTENELARYFTLTKKDLEIIQRKSGDLNRLGFALQLASLRFSGRSWDVDQPVPIMVVRRLAQQLEVNAEELETYAIKRPNTRREHLREIVEEYSFRYFSENKAELKMWLLPIARSTDNGFILVRSLVEHCRKEKIITPALSSLEAFVWEIRCGRVSRGVQFNT